MVQHKCSRKQQQQQSSDLVTKHHSWSRLLNDCKENSRGEGGVELHVQDSVGCIRESAANVDQGALHRVVAKGRSEEVDVGNLIIGNICCYAVDVVICEVGCLAANGLRTISG